MGFYFFWLQKSLMNACKECRHITIFAVFFNSVCIIIIIRPKKNKFPHIPPVLADISDTSQILDPNTAGEMSSGCYSYLVVQGCPNPWRGGDTGTLILGPLPPSLQTKLPGMKVIISVFNSSTGALMQLVAHFFIKEAAHQCYFEVIVRQK